jgi:putative phosphoribosyl transferase
MVVMFEDRKDAGKKLAKRLAKYKGKNVLILGIPRGGVEVAYEVAEFLDAELSILVSRKLPFPFNTEAGFGAITEDGSTIIQDGAYSWLSREEIEKIIREQKQEIARRIRTLRKSKPLPRIKGRTVILVDDGLAMGSTMKVSIKLCKNKEAGKIIAAVPVSGESVCREIEGMVDEIVVLEIPPFFQAVAQVYVNWYDVQDSEVIEILDRWKNKQD